MEYIQIQSIPPKKWLHGMLQLHEQIFGDSNPLMKQLGNKQGLLTLLAINQQQVVGYKVGYELKPHKFYSWLGGVHQDYRDLGIASELMKKQHQFLKNAGYQVVQTKTKNKWRHMLILNIKNGFDVIGTYNDEKGEPKIILEKRLDKEK
ncbi:GNAT family N-acetyltransferase [Melghirimyces algeriensis]|uniref:N-acetyltransferase domain-containing protein n=1 Tax=Melghirimyces algeriensis TaxID=910412 RepID=A0A521CDL0_9BACL|nr:GNAT family N-acetyltransferase [Melghirimyces algeriensis]SMO57455.1 hypothetical protein SAMN06264849_103290 [Melghirimyces algeriensis]